MKLCSSLLVVFGRSFCEENGKFGYMNPILAKLGVTRKTAQPWLVARWKAFVRLFIALIELFCYLFICYGSTVMRRMCTRRTP